MGYITIDELSAALKAYLESLGLSEEEVNEIVNNALVSINEKNEGQDDAIEGIETKIGELSGLATQEKSSIVAAINELFQNANNGKELIANAIGEPLSKDDTFSAMSDDINGLLSTFKTNMMNNGVTVEAGDKFKALIDKIATLADNEGKGIQFAEGSIDVDQTYRFENISSTHTFNFSSELDFTPNYIFVRVPGVRSTTTGYGTVDVSNAIITNKFNSNFGNILGIGSNDLEFYVQSVTANGFTVKGDTSVNFGDSSFSDYYGTNKLEWCAIGVGEEDTTLRDSLAAILQEEGVTVSDTDDMATLIGKVDQEFDRQVVPQGTAVASNVLSGKTFINSTGNTVTGTMTDRGGAQTVTPGTSNKTLNAGYYSGNITVKGDSNLVASNIVSGKSIFGVSGTAKTGGMQIASGTFDYVSSVSSITVTTNLDFTPQYIFVLIAGSTMSGDSGQTGKNIVVSNLAEVSFTGNNVYKYSIQNISSTSFEFNCVTRNIIQATITCNWYAFG